MKFMNSPEKQEYRSKQFIPTDRIGTQIHRRRTVQVFSRLQIEWDSCCPSETECPPVGPDIETESVPESSPETSHSHSQT